MSRAPTVFGVPLWRGVRWRIGKKYLPKDRDFRRRVLVQWRDARLGDLYSDCSGLNRRLAAVEPEYRIVNRRGGKVLMDLEFTAEDGSSCSFYHCGVGPPLTYEQAERFRSELVEEERAKGDPEGFAQQYSPEVMTIHPDGTFTIDRDALARLEARHAPPESVSDLPPPRSKTPCSPAGRLH
jgi:hypothetical protein